MVILVAEISGGVWAYMNRAELHKMVRETVRNTVQKEYTKDNVTTTTFDMIQQSLQCCGSHDYKSWFGSAFHPGGLGRLDIGVSSQNQNISHVVPESCCVEPGTPECKKARQDVKPEHNPKIIYTEVNSLSFSSSSSPPLLPHFSLFLRLPPSPIPHSRPYTNPIRTLEFNSRLPSVFTFTFRAHPPVFIRPIPSGFIFLFCCSFKRLYSNRQSISDSSNPSPFDAQFLFLLLLLLSFLFEWVSALCGVWNDSGRNSFFFLKFLNFLSLSFLSRLNKRRKVLNQPDMEWINPSP